jgi:protocatechuate 3,4-dioxygenase beta subunit
MMIFINSWKLKNFFANKIIWKSDRFSHFWDSRGKISLFDNKFNPIGTVNTDAKGNYTFSVECGKTYNVRAEKKTTPQRK